MTEKASLVLRKILIKAIMLSSMCGVVGSLLVVILYTVREFLFVDLINRQLTFQYVLLSFITSLILGVGGAAIGGGTLSIIFHNDYKNHKIDLKRGTKKGTSIGFLIGVLLAIFIYSNYSVNLISFDLMLLYSSIAIIFATVSGWWIAYRLIFHIQDNSIIWGEE